MKKVLLIVGGLILAVFVLAALAGGENGNDTNGNGDSETVEEGNSRTNPVPMGETASIDGWDITVVDTIQDATNIVRDENQFNEPPQEGRQYFIATIEATFTGEGTDEDSSQFWLDVTTNVVDNNSVTYSAMDDYCGVIPNSLEDVSEVFEGGTITGNLCWPVDSEQVGSLVMFAEPLFSFSGDRTWFALQ